MNWAFIVFIAVVVWAIISLSIALIVIILNKKQNFSSKKDKSIKLYNLIDRSGGINNLNYENFKNLYPNGDNILYYNLKNIKPFNIENIENII